MRRVSFFFVAMAGIFSGVNAAEMPDPIAPAASGQVQCYLPDAARKTCASIAGYRRTAGGIENIATVLISKDPVGTMETTSPVEIKMGQVCGKIRRQDLEAAKFTLAGRPLDAQQAASVRAQLQMALQNIFDHEVCTAFVSQGSSLVAKATIDGVAAPPTADQQVVWVSPSDGYKVSP